MKIVLFLTVASILDTEAADRIRLVNGGMMDGRIEVKIGSIWGTVCDRQFDQAAAQVACSQLGFPIEFAKQVVNTWYRIAPSSQRVWLTELRCKGNEEALIACSYGQIGNSPCDHSTDVAITCEKPSVLAFRLTIDSSSGRYQVQVYTRNEWGGICGNGFDIKAARVACRQMGFAFSGAVAVDSHPCQDCSRPIWLQGVHCTGEEASLQDCQHSPVREDDCSDSGLVSVICVESKNVTDYSIRLVDGVNDNTGTLQVFLWGRWGTVCFDNFDMNEAEVVCRQLGSRRSPSLDYTMTKPFPEILLSDVSCYGDDIASLKECTHDAPGNSYCHSRRIVTIDCEEKEGHTAVITAGLLGGLTAIIIMVVACCSKKRIKNRLQEFRARRRNSPSRRSATTINQSLNYTINVQFDASSETLRMGLSEPENVIVSPQNPGVYIGPPRYDQLFPDGEPATCDTNEALSLHANEPPPPPYPGPSPADSTSTQSCRFSAYKTTSQLSDADCTEPPQYCQLFPENRETVL